MFSKMPSTTAVVDVAGLGPHGHADLYDAWFAAQQDADRAFRAWCTAPMPDRRDLQVVYRAALDREEQAAAMLAVAFRARAGSR